MRLNAFTAVLAVNLGLAAALVYLWTDEGRWRWPEPEALPPSLAEVAPIPASEPAEVARYRETLERPLFASTRRIAPRSDPQGEGKEAVDPLKDVRLLGTYGAGSRGGVVIIAAGKLQRVAIGDRIGEWTVAGEEGRGAAFVRANGERRRLDLALNTTAVAGADAKPTAPAAEQAPAADPGRPSRRAQPAQSQREAAGSASGQSSELREQLRRKRLERINERRAAQGLAPVPANR